jgi:ElaB/YqjD/DUF883 family membrane-anchored ribosome-binding protein
MNNNATAADSDTALDARGCDPRVERSEAEFLQHQTRQALAELSASLAEVKQGLADAVDVRLWTRRHPWASVGVAAAAGFTAATLVMPSKDETFGEKLSKLVHRPAPSSAASPSEPAPFVNAAVATTTPVLTITLINSAFELAKALVQRLPANAPPASAAVEPPSDPTSCASDAAAPVASTPTHHVHSAS